MLFSTAVFAQIKTPAPSPGATVRQDLGLSKVSIKYSRPGIKGRTIYGGLVPFDKMWRTGANAATTIKFSSDVKVEGQDLKAGKYAILTIPGKDEWTIIFSNNSATRPPNYKQEEDALRITVKPTSYSEKVETFTFNFTDVKDNSLNVQMLWENTSVSFSVTVDVDSEVMNMIDKTMAGVSSRDYYAAAKYYYNNDKDIKQAVTWITKSVEMDQEKPKFWVVHWQALIYAKAGKKAEAIKAAERSKELSIKAEYDEYVKKNEALLKELKGGK
tara:strand:- start:1039 stop:1854 length:816 start_codon:yes stop_codon:yes gene_type:complete